MFIFGNSELARVAEYYFRHVPQHERSWLADFSNGIIKTVEKDYIKDPLAEIDFDRIDRGQIFIPIGYKNLNQDRERIFNISRAKGLITLDHISAEAKIHKDVKINPNSGNWIQESVAIQTGSSLGRGNVLWGGGSTHVGHKTSIADWNWISTGTVIAGGCKINSNCFFGINSSIRNNIEIASHNIICMAAIVTKNTKPYQVYGPGLNNLLDIDARDFKIDK